MSQPAKLLNYLQQHGSITRRDAAIKLGIMNLWCRVSDLERLGWGFDRQSIQVPTEGGYTTVTRYTLISSPDQTGQGVLPARVSTPSHAAPALFLSSDVVESPHSDTAACQ